MWKVVPQPGNAINQATRSCLVAAACRGRSICQLSGYQLPLKAIGRSLLFVLHALWGSLQQLAGRSVDLSSIPRLLLQAPRSALNSIGTPHYFKSSLLVEEPQRRLCISQRAPQLDVTSAVVGISWCLGQTFCI
jgi:hypothetical protein